MWSGPGLSASHALASLCVGFILRLHLITWWLPTLPWFYISDLNPVEMRTAFSFSPAPQSLESHLIGSYWILCPPESLRPAGLVPWLARSESFGCPWSWGHVHTDREEGNDSLEEKWPLFQEKEEWILDVKSIDNRNYISLSLFKPTLKVIYMSKYKDLSSRRSSGICFVVGSYRTVTKNNIVFFF